MRVTHGFQCTECRWHNYPRLNLGLTGNYTIRCGHCGHNHYRVVERGRVTSDRHYAKYGDAEVIHVMGSACQPKPREMGKVARLRNLLPTGLLDG